LTLSILASCAASSPGAQLVLVRVLGVAFAGRVVGEVAAQERQVAVLDLREAARPGRPIGRDLGLLQPAVAGVDEEVVAGRDGLVDDAEIEVGRRSGRRRGLGSRGCVGFDFLGAGGAGSKRQEREGEELFHGDRLLAQRRPRDEGEMRAR
jgi:hypothetical protein